MTEAEKLLQQRQIGKFSNELVIRLHLLSMDSCDAQIGDVTDYGKWYGLLLDNDIEGAEYAILTEDSQGFVDAFLYDSESQVRKDWAAIEVEYEQWCNLVD